MNLDIIICINANESSSVIGLRNMLMPLRSSSIDRKDLSLIILVSDVSYLRKEWEMISTFPELYILNVS